MRIFTALLAIVPLVAAGNYNLPCPNDMMCGYICCSPGEICENGGRCLPPAYISDAIVSNLPKSEAKSVLAALSSGNSQVVSSILTAYDTLMTAAAPMPTFASSNIYSTSTPCTSATHTDTTATHTDTTTTHHDGYAPPPPAVTTVMENTTTPNVSVSTTSIAIQSGNDAARRAAGGVGFVAAVAGAVVAFL